MILWVKPQRKKTKTWVAGAGTKMERDFYEFLQREPPDQISKSRDSKKRITKMKRKDSIPISWHFFLRL